jgi:hypothetical protein
MFAQTTHDDGFGQQFTINFFTREEVVNFLIEHGCEFPKNTINQLSDNGLRFQLQYWNF